MERTDTALSRSSNHEATIDWQAEPLTLYPTPGEIIGQIGRVILACLMLGLVAHLLVAIVGIH